MPHFADIWDAVREDVAKRRVVDVDAQCRRFAALYPGIAREEIRETILDAVGMYGGAATWGTDAPEVQRGEKS